jgi:hypothetical protein
VELHSHSQNSSMAFIGTTLLIYPLNSRLGRPESRSGCFGTGKNQLPLPGIESRILDHQRIVFFFCAVVLRPNAGQSLLIPEVSRSHTTTHHSRKDSSGQMIARRKDLSLTTHNTHNRHPSIHPWDSNPQSRQASGRRATPQTARPLRLAHCLISVQ